MNIDDIILEIQKDVHSKKCNKIIRDHEPFIKATISKKLDRYIYTDNEDVYSVGLSAFLESIVNFNPAKGHFYGFASLVIQRRVSNYVVRNREYIHENIDDIELSDQTELFEEQFLLKDEIVTFERTLYNFGITFDDLIQDAPKHIDTRNRAKKIGKETSEHHDLVERLYHKKKLPVTEMCKRFMVTRKIIYGCKKYITSIVIIYIEKFDMIKKWI